MRTIYLTGVYYDDHGSHNDVHLSHNDAHHSHNDIRASTKLFSLNLIAHFQRLFCRFMKGVSVKHWNKLEAKLDNYIRIFCTYSVHFYDWFSDICSRCAPPFLENWALKSILYNIQYTCLGSNNRKFCNVVTTLYLRTLYQTPEHVGKMLISTNKRAQFPCNVRFSDSWWSHLPTHKISKFSTESLYAYYMIMYSTFSPFSKKIQLHNLF